MIAAAYMHKLFICKPPSSNGSLMHQVLEPPCTLPNTVHFPSSRTSALPCLARLKTSLSLPAHVHWPCSMAFRKDEMSLDVRAERTF